MSTILQPNEYATYDYKQSDLNIYITDCLGRLTDPQIIKWTIFKKTDNDPKQITLSERPAVRHDVGQYYSSWRVPSDVDDSDHYYILWRIRLCEDSPDVYATQWFSIRYLSQIGDTFIPSSNVSDGDPDYGLSGEEQFDLILTQLGLTADQYAALGNAGDSTTLVSLTGYNIKFSVKSPYWVAVANPEPIANLRESVGNKDFYKKV